MELIMQKPNNILVMPMCKSEIKEVEKYRTIPPSTSKVTLVSHLD